MEISKRACTEAEVKQSCLHMEIALMTHRSRGVGETVLSA